MQPFIEQLQSEIENDPQNLGYAGLEPMAVLAILSEQSRDYMIEPATPDVANFLINHGMMAALMVAQESANYSQFPNELKVALKFVLMLNSSNTPTMNFNNAVTKSAVAGLVAAGLWKQEQVDELIQKLSLRKRSRAVELWNRDVELVEVARALWADKIAAAEQAQGAANIRVDELYQGIDNEI